MTRARIVRPFERRIAAGTTRPVATTCVLYRMPAELLLEGYRTGDLDWWDITTLGDYLSSAWEFYPIGTFYENGFDETDLARITAAELGPAVYLQPFTAYLRTDWQDWQPQPSYWVIPRRA